MRRWITARRWRFIWRRNEGENRVQRKVASHRGGKPLHTHNGWTDQRPRETLEGSRGPSPHHLRNRLSWSRQPRPPVDAGPLLGSDFVDVVPTIEVKVAVSG